MITLEVGTVLYADRSFGNGVQKYVIDRTTAKRAYSETIEFDKEQNSDGFRARGSNGWSAPHYYLETEEWKTKWICGRLTRKIQNIKVDSLTIDQMTRIVAITEEKEPTE